MSEWQTHAELAALLERLFEGELDESGAARVEELVGQSPEAMWFYLSYTDLHGTLYWDAPGALPDVAELSGDSGSADSTTPPQPVPALVAPIVPGPASGGRPGRIAWGVLAAGLALSLGWLALGPTASMFSQAPSVAHQEGVMPPTLPAGMGAASEDGRGATASEGANPQVAASTSRPRQPIVLEAHAAPAGDGSDSSAETQPPQVVVAEPADGASAMLTSADVDVGGTIRLINEQLALGWTSAGITPSEPATDGEWLRRVYLDLTGRIPSLDEQEQFYASDATRRRAELVDRLLEGADFPRHYATVFGNLLIGRQPNPQVNRQAFLKYLRMSLAQNRSWNDIVYDLVSAEGRNDEVGQTNFLLAHLNNQAVPATAVTARVFLGNQLQCAQCHNHPFDSTRQVAFWEFNSFFQQTEAERLRAGEGQPVRTARGDVFELVSRPVGGAIYYETRNGLMKAAMPRFNGHEIAVDPEVNRRQELAKLMTRGRQPQLAAAFVNRMWRQLVGASFTREVDNMGPHNPATHPLLLEGLSERFVASGYDLRFLVRSICLSDVYQRTSRVGTSNASDDPSTGELPLFSRVYPRSMSSEQLFDSLVVATNAQPRSIVDRETQTSLREDWVGQFVVSMQTEENDESNTLDGTVAQALALMNGELIRAALDVAPSTVLGKTLVEASSDNDRINRLCRITLGREPTPRELPAMRRLVRAGGDAATRPTRASVEGYQDLVWALLNSNEFVTIH